MIVNVDATMKRYNNLSIRFKSKLKKFSKKKTDIPIIINNFNRLTFLMSLIKRLEEDGYKNIYIIDNNSTYQELLNYYKNINYTIFRLNKNIGKHALWHTHLYGLFQNDYFVFTDSDMIPDNDCPSDYIAIFKQLLEKYPKYDKVGFGLRIDDLPDYYNLKQQVIKWENKFWEKEIENNVYRANIATTFALYRPFAAGDAESTIALRTGFPYVAKHLPWYLDSNNLSEEEKYYIQSAEISSSWYKRVDKSGKYEWN